MCPIYRYLRSGGQEANSNAWAARPAGDLMQNDRSDPSAVAREPNLSDQALPKETDLRRRIQSLQCIICDLLVENERLRQYLAAEQIHIE
jgi:hypothetical protein